MSAPALENTRTPPRASFLGLPREIRDKIYSYLLTCHSLPDCEAKREVIIPAWCTRAKDPISLHFLYYETTSHLYHRPTYAFTLHNPLNYSSPNETEANMSFLASSPYNPVHHIRRILVEADLPAPMVDNNDSRSIALLFEVSAKLSFRKCDVCIVDALASRATSLERLEIMFSRQGAGPGDNRTVIKLVERLRGTLREVVVVGTVDREWMQKVMELGVTVRAQTLNDGEDEPTRLELKQFSMLRRSGPKMVLRYLLDEVDIFLLGNSLTRCQLRHRDVETYNTRDSLVVTATTTSLAITGLSMGELTGSGIL
ncbi:hypothetical protein B0T18DRAFT_393214 [Schizothecium vesticola]|uniref:Uncharacterized protein n=1 Tax=Schizothecium vesticola TaxID=314040 RepID=A0AA40EJA3_9PEZI|nr:hypothetical protein B0T18DRAFT_393214 [Schizothecium vesticola]